LAGKLVIVVALVTWWTERGDRLDAKHNQAWTLIASAAGKGGDLGRTSAMRQLNNDGIDMDYIPLEGASIRDIFIKVDMRQADFRHAHLLGVYFSVSSSLEGADFSGAELALGGFFKPNLKDTKFVNAEVIQMPIEGSDETTRG